MQFTRLSECEVYCDITVLTSYDILYRGRGIIRYLYVCNCHSITYISRTYRSVTKTNVVLV